MKTRFYNTEKINSQIHHYGKNGLLDNFSVSFVLLDSEGWDAQFSRSCLQTEEVKNAREAKKAILREVKDICKDLNYSKVAQITIL